MNYLLATALAVEVTVLHNFFWHERFTWGDRKTRDRFTRLLKFNLTTGVFSIAGNLAFTKLLVGTAGLNYLFANGISIAACSVINFFLNDRLVFVFAQERRSGPALRLHSGVVPAFSHLYVLKFPELSWLYLRTIVSTHAREALVFWATAAQLHTRSTSSKALLIVSSSFLSPARSPVGCFGISLILSLGVTGENNGQRILDYFLSLCLKPGGARRIRPAGGSRD
jgi:putative flippase GtrA